MKTTRYVLASLVLAVSIGCGRSNHDPARTALPEAPPAAPTGTAQTHSAKMPVKTDADDSKLPLQITVKSPEVPQRLRGPSPPIRENSEK